MENLRRRRQINTIGNFWTENSRENIWRWLFPLDLVSNSPNLLLIGSAYVELIFVGNGGLNEGRFLGYFTEFTSAKQQVKYTFVG